MKFYTIILKVKSSFLFPTEIIYCDTIRGRRFTIIFLTLCFSLFSYVKSWSQQGAGALQQSVLPLKVGDELPYNLWDLTLPVVNHQEGKQTIKLADYKGKLIILDFWATWCPGCITSLQKLDTIQRELANEVVIIPVTNDNVQKAEAFIKARKWQLPTVVNNRILHEYFPHKYIPHYIWVNAEGKIQAITGPESVNRKQIIAVINGENSKLPIKVDQLSFDFKKPLFINGNGGDGEAITYRSLFSEPLPGLFQTTSTVIADTVNNTSRVFGINCRPIMLYSLAYQKIVTFTTDRIKYEIQDSAKRSLFVSSEDNNQRTKNKLFTYELITPLSDPEAVRERVAIDLQHFFGLNARFEQRATDCYILTALPNLHNSFSKGGERKDNLFQEQSEEKYIQNQTIDMLQGYLSEILPLSVVDETKCPNAVDLVFPEPDSKNLKPLQEALRKQGISLERGKRDIEFFVITDN